MFLTLFLALFLSSFCVESSIDGLSLAKSCFNEWIYSKASGTDYEIHCFRLELLMKCLSKPATDTNRMLDDFRFITQQEAIFAKKYKICPKLQPEEYEKIKELVKQAGIVRHYGYDQIDDDQFSECAKKVHTTCINEYIDVFYKHRMCRDFTAFIACLHDQRTKTKCESKLIEHMIHMFDKVGNDFVKQMRIHLGIKCPQETTQK